jgi:hypothetical protein
MKAKLSCLKTVQLNDDQSQFQRSAERVERGGLAPLWDSFVIAPDDTLPQRRQAAALHTLRAPLDVRSLSYLLLFFLLACLPAAIPAQTATQPKASATISGRVLIGSEPAAGVEVMLVAGNPGGMMIMNINGATGGNQSPPMSVVTDADGRFQMTGVAPGSYRISAYAPAYVTPGESGGPINPGRAITVAEGETIDNLEFTLRPGGVVTGKVTDAEGKPVIAERITAARVDESGKRSSSRMPGLTQWETDDRGVYRIFGLDPGRYLIYAGSGADDMSFRFGSSGGYYKRTFHPDATEEPEARIIEVRAGAETESVDIKMARATKGYAATGRVIEAETGKPVAGMMISYGVTKGGFASMSMGGAATNSLGEFRLEGLSPNSYKAQVVSIQATEFYAGPVSFEVIGGDVTGLEIKMHRGATISGTAIVEGATDPSVMQNLSKLQVSAMPVQTEGVVRMGMSGDATIAPNGSFRINGVPPGKTRITVSMFSAPKGLSLQRVEYNGAEVKELDVSPGDNLTGVRLVFVYGNATITGRVEIRNGSLPPDARLVVMPMREGSAGGPMSGIRPAEVDNRGQFTIEGLAAGTYKLRLGQMRFSPDDQRRLPTVEQLVSVSGSGRQEVTLILDLAAKREEDK